MKATAQVTLSINDKPKVVLEHDDKQLVFSINVFGRKYFQGDYDVFSHINQFWANKPQHVQDDIFNIYRECLFIMENVNRPSEQIDLLTNEVAKLMDHHQLEDIEDWIAFKSDIMVPSSIDMTYEHSVDRNTSREKTYIRGDYLKLVSMTLALRVMVPIWGEFITLIRKEIGTLFKEFYAFQLLKKSHLINSPPLIKLNEYIDFTAGEDKNRHDNTLKGISSEDMSYWLMSLVCVRRLCTGDIRGLDTGTTLITYIYSFVVQKVQTGDNNHENTIKEKRIDQSSKDSENKISTLERYKIKTNISPGEIVELEYSLRDMRNIVTKLTCKVDDEFLERSLKTSSVLANERMLDPQMMLLRWVFKPVISPRGLMYLTAPVITRALGALEAVLWARGHKYLAILASAHAMISDSEMMISPVDSKMRVAKELSDKLDELYPFVKESNKKNPSKPVNMAANSIDKLTDNLMLFSWKATADDSMLMEVFGSTSRCIPIRADIKTDLTKLVIELGERSWI